MGPLLLQPWLLMLLLGDRRHVTSSLIVRNSKHGRYRKDGRAASGRTGRGRCSMWEVCVLRRWEPLSVDDLSRVMVQRLFENCLLCLRVQIHSTSFRIAVVEFIFTDARLRAGEFNTKQNVSVPILLSIAVGNVHIVCFASKTSHHSVFTAVRWGAVPSPPLDNIRVMVIVWRLRGNIFRTALCWIVWHNVHSLQHTYMSSSYRSNRLGLSHWDPYAVHRGGCLETLL